MSLNTLAGYLAASQIAKAYPTARFCYFRVFVQDDKEKKMPMKKAGEDGVDQNTPDESLLSASDLLDASIRPPANATHFGVVMHRPTRNDAGVLVCLDVDAKNTANKKMTGSQQGLFDGARGFGLLTEISHSGAGSHIFLTSPSDELLPPKIGVSKGADIEVFGLENSHKTSVMLTDKKVAGAVDVIDPKPFIEVYGITVPAVPAVPKPSITPIAPLPSAGVPPPINKPENASEAHQADPLALVDEWRAVNDAALASLESWVLDLFPDAKQTDHGYRVTSASLRRNLEEDISIHRDGIKDFGVHDMGDPRGGKRTAIDLVAEHLGIKPQDAARWLDSRVKVGFGQSSKTSPSRLDGLLTPITIDELRSAKLTPREILPQFLYADVRTRIAAGGTGKTTLALYEAVKLALGKALWGRLPPFMVKTVIVTREDSRGILVARMREIMHAQGLTEAEVAQVLERVFIIDLSGHPYRLSTVENDVVMPHKDNLESLIGVLQAIKPDWVIFDPLVSFGVGESRVNDAEQGLIEAFRVIRNRLDCCVEVIHHTGKANARDKTTDQYSGRGGSALADGSRMVAVLVPLNATEWSDATGTTLGLDESGMVMVLPKLSYSGRQTNIFIRRFGYRFTEEAHEPQTPEQAAEQRAKDLYTFIHDEYARGNRYSKTDLEESREELEMSRAEIRAAILSLKVAGRVLYHEVKGKAGSHYEPLGSVAEGDGDTLDSEPEKGGAIGQSTAAEVVSPPLRGKDGGDTPSPATPSFPEVLPQESGEGRRHRRHPTEQWTPHPPTGLQKDTVAKVVQTAKWKHRTFFEKYMMSCGLAAAKGLPSVSIMTVYDAHNNYDPEEIETTIKLNGITKWTSPDGIEWYVADLKMTNVTSGKVDSGEACDEKAA